MRRLAAVLVVVFGVALLGAGDANEAATARKFAAIRNQPLALEAFLREMPKGGDLHNHLSGAIYAESYLRWAADDKLCLVVATLAFAQPTPQAPCDAATGRPLAAVVFQNSTLYNQAIDAMSMRNWPPGINGHDHFFQAFAKFGAVSSVHVGEELADVTSQAAAEHVSYLELMLTPDGGVAARLGQRAGWNPDLAQMRARLLASGWGDVLAQTKQRLDGFEARRRDLLKCGTSAADAGCQVTVRYISQVGRASPPEEVFAQIMAGFDLSTNEPRVVGLNLVQPEDDATAVRDFMLHMNIIDFLRPFYPNAHISLHAGELADGLVPPGVLRFHIRESVRKGHAERIGHGASAMQEDNPYGLMRELAAKKVLVEIALTSNDMILGVKGPASAADVSAVRRPRRARHRRLRRRAIEPHARMAEGRAGAGPRLPDRETDGQKLHRLRLRRREDEGRAQAGPRQRLPSVRAAGDRCRADTVIDSHCHLADEVFAADLDAVIARAKDAGLERAMTVLAAGDDKEAAQALRVVSLWPECRFAIGVHPHAAGSFADRPERAADIVRAQIAKTPAARAIGEIGLDYHYDFAPPTSSSRCFARRSRSRASSICRWSFIRARRTTTPCASFRRRERTRAVGNCAGCCTASRAGRRWRAPASISASTFRWRASLRFRRRRSSGTRRAACRSIACSSRPTARFWRRCRIAARGTSPRTWRGRGGRSRVARYSR